MALDQAIEATTEVHRQFLMSTSPTVSVAPSMTMEEAIQAMEQNYEQAHTVCVALSEKYRPLVEWNRVVHAELITSGKPNYGHSADHDLCVGVAAALCAEDNRVGEMAFCAAHMHSWDRHGHDMSVLKALMREGLSFITGQFSNEELLLIVGAVDKHSEKWGDKSNSVLIALQDGDKIANLGAINITRGGQHRPHIPAVDPCHLDAPDPASTFKNPRTCFDATKGNLDWEGMLVSPKARELARPRLEFTKFWRRFAKAEFLQLGIDGSTFRR